MATDKLSPFGKAFREARQRGDKTFEFNGKKYTTELAGEKKSSPAPAPAPRSVAPPPAEEDAETRQRRTTSMPSGSLLGRISKSQGAESSFPEPKEESSVGARAAARRQEDLDTFSRMGKKLARVFGTQEARDRARAEDEAVPHIAKGGKVGSASKRADGIAQRGKTKGRMI